MKTIAISGELPKYRLCTACRSDNDVREITFAYDNGTFKQGMQITLCKECRKDLVKVLTEDLLAEYGKCDSEEFDEAIEAVAWMPLPKPWKGADDERGR